MPEELLVLVTFGMAVTPEGSEALPSKDHRKLGEGTPEGRLLGSMRVAEHISE